MAIVKPIKVRSGNLTGFRAVINYVKDETKTSGGKLVYMSGGMAGREFEDMVLTKNLYGKTTGRQYAHFVQSFHEQDDLTPELAFQIGREYIAGLKQWSDYQVLMAVHTNTENLHIHYVINSVSNRDGRKWQCSKQDLNHFRQQSDELCRKYNLHVIEHGNRGNRSYSEHTAYQKGASWKAMLSADIADCLQHAKSKVDFLHRLDERGIDADFGQKNVMFLVRAGTYGLKEERKISNYALASYGDFSRRNILNHFKLNKGLLDLAFDDLSLFQEAFLEIGRMMFPNNPTELQDRYFSGIELADFDRLTREEIESYLKQKKLEQLQKNAWSEHEKQSQSNGAMLACIADTLSMVLEHRENQITWDYSFMEHENEYEL